MPGIHVLAEDAVNAGGDLRTDRIAIPGPEQARVAGAASCSSLQAQRVHLVERNSGG